MFWFSRKAKVVLECFTYQKHIHDLYPIIESSKAIPDWFSNMKGNYLGDDFVPASTVKKCPAVAKNIMAGFIMPLWSDLALFHDSVNKQCKWQFSDNGGLGSHSAIQWDAWKDPKNVMHLKLDSPWRFRTKQELKFLWQAPYFHKTNSVLEVVQGIDSYHCLHSTNINCFVDITKDYTTLIRANTPLVHLIPMTEKEVIVKNIFISKEEWEQMNKPNPTFQASYKVLTKSKCPFHRK